MSSLMHGIHATGIFFFDSCLKRDHEKLGLVKRQGIRKNPESNITNELNCFRNQTDMSLLGKGAKKKNLTLKSGFSFHNAIIF